MRPASQVSFSSLMLKELLSSLKRSLAESLHSLLELQRSLACTCTGSLITLLSLSCCISCKCSINLFNLCDKFFHNTFCYLS